MKKIASFTINHNTLMPGVYISRIDGDITTYDMRFVKPNTPPYLPNPIKQCAEHKGEIPGTTAIECGNYLEHDLDGALKELNKYYSLLRNYTVDNLKYN